LDTMNDELAMQMN